MKARSGASKQIASYAIPHIRATRWPMAMSDHTVPAVSQLQVLLQRQESFHLGLNGLFEQPARPRTQKRGQRIVDLVGLAKVNNAVILVHGVALPRGGSGRFVAHLDTPPSSPRHHPVSAIARRRAIHVQRVAALRDRFAAA
jgi:hypothetical protein